MSLLETPVYTGIMSLLSGSGGANDFSTAIGGRFSFIKEDGLTTPYSVGELSFPQSPFNTCSYLHNIFLTVNIWRNVEKGDEVLSSIKDKLYSVLTEDNLTISGMTVFDIQRMQAPEPEQDDANIQKAYAIFRIQLQQSRI